MSFASSMIRLEIGLKAHVLNWPWRDRMLRRKIRNDVLGTVLPKYLKRYLPPKNFKAPTVVHDDATEKIYSIWFQGKDSAPKWVKACFRSVERNCPQEHVVLDEKTVFDYIELPEYIMEKRKYGKISHAHFADIARVELLNNYGGIWMDASGYVTSPPPAWMIEQDFFAYLVNPESVGFGWRYSFMQNCFFRARKGSYILAAWRYMIHEFWKHENTRLDYMIHQLMFKTLVMNDPRAIAEFAKMPHVYQNTTHALWWEYKDKPFDQKIYDEITGKTWVQKTTYRNTENLTPGSFADHMVKA